MAEKNYMSDWEGLEFALEKSGTTKWSLLRGFQQQNNKRSALIYAQENEEVSTQESFDLLKQQIQWNSQGGGNFTIYFPGKAANHGTSIHFKVTTPGTVTQAGISGVSSGIYGVGVYNEQQMQKFISDAVEKENLRRDVEDLKAALGSPGNFWQSMFQEAMQNDTLKDVAKELLGIVKMKIAPRPMMPAQVSMQGIEGSTVPSTMPTEPKEGYETDYPEEMYAFADWIGQQIQNTELERKFWQNLFAFAQANPAYLQQLMK